MFWTDGQYFGPAAIVNAHRFIFDSRDEGSQVRLDILNDKEGVWRCRTTFNCSEACPRGIEVTKAISEVKQAILRGSPDLPAQDLRARARLRRSAGPNRASGRAKPKAASDSFESGGPRFILFAAGAQGRRDEGRVGSVPASAGISAGTDRVRSRWDVGERSLCEVVFTGRDRGMAEL